MVLGCIEKDLLEQLREADEQKRFFVPIRQRGGRFHGLAGELFRTLVIERGERGIRPVFPGLCGQFLIATANRFFKGGQRFLGAVLRREKNAEIVLHRRREGGIVGGLRGLEALAQEGFRPVGFPDRFPRKNGQGTARRLDFGGSALVLGLVGQRVRGIEGGDGEALLAECLAGRRLAQECANLAAGVFHPGEAVLCFLPADDGILKLPTLRQLFARSHFGFGEAFGVGAGGGVEAKEHQGNNQYPGGHSPASFAARITWWSLARGGPRPQAKNRESTDLCPARPTGTKPGPQWIVDG